MAGGRRGRIRQGLKALSIADRVALFRALVAIPVIALALRFAGLRRTQGALARVNRLKPPFKDDLEEARRYGRVVAIAGGHGLVRPNCLQRSLVLWAILRRRRIDTQLRIGVSPPTGEDGIRFHAWLELAGEVVNDRSDISDLYQPFEAPIEAESSAFDR